MRRLIKVAGYLFLLSVVGFAGVSFVRPDLVPAWARLGHTVDPSPKPEGEVASAWGLEEGPDDRWLAFKGSAASKEMKRSLPTVRLASAETSKLVGLKTAKAVALSIAPNVTGNAEISFVSHDYAHITSRVAGRITEVPVDEGDTVKKGDVLVVVDSAEVGSAKAQYLSLLPMVDLARREATRALNLRASGAASEKEELAAQANLAKVEAELLNARQQLLNMSYTESDLTQIGKTRDTTNLLKIVAPMSGRLVERHSVIGEAVTPPGGPVTSGQMQSLFEIADLREMWAWIDVSEGELSKVAIGQEVDFTISGTGTPIFPGHVELISFAVNPQTRTVRVRAGLKNLDERLRANQYGRAVIRVGPERASVIIPREAVQSNGDEEYVFLPKEDGVRFRTQRVMTRPCDRPGWVEVAFGLKAGDEVVTTGSFLLKTELYKSNLAGGE